MTLKSRPFLIMIKNGLDFLLLILYDNLIHLYKNSLVLVKRLFGFRTTVLKDVYFSTCLHDRVETIGQSTHDSSPGSGVVVYKASSQGKGLRLETRL